MREENLTSIWWEDGEAITAGKDGVDKIVLRNDGHGMFGRYDRIHVYTDRPGFEHQVYPAHHLSGWTVKEDQ